MRVCLIVILISVSTVVAKQSDEPMVRRDHSSDPKLGKQFFDSVGVLKKRIRSEQEALRSYAIEYANTKIDIERKLEATKSEPERNELKLELRIWAAMTRGKIEVGYEKVLNSIVELFEIEQFLGTDLGTRQMLEETPKPAARP